jgi:hypothetical protein
MTSEAQLNIVLREDGHTVDTRLTAQNLTELRGTFSALVRQADNSKLYHKLLLLPARCTGLTAKYSGHNSIHISGLALLQYTGLCLLSRFSSNSSLTIDHACEKLHILFAGRLLYHVHDLQGPCKVTPSSAHL